MAQTKRKRRSKHRGTAAGSVAVRGRTSRPLSPEERKKVARQEARDQRLNSPPTWKSSFRRAALACGLMFVFLLVLGLNGKKGTNPVIYALIFSIFALLLYVPAGYYLETWFWRRRMRRREEQRQAQR